MGHIYCEKLLGKQLFSNFSLALLGASSIIAEEESDVREFRDELQCVISQIHSSKWAAMMI